MKSTNDRDKSIDALLRSSFKAGPLGGGAPGPCIEPETMAAWTEGRLPGREAAQVEAHLASCASCQEILAVFSRAQTEPATPIISGFSRIRWWLVPAAAAATAAAIWVAIPDRRTVDEFEQTVAPAVETIQVQPNVPSAADTAAPAAPAPAVPRRDAPADALADRAASAAAAPERREQDQIGELKAERAQPTAAPQAAAAPKELPAPSTPAPPPAQDQARFSGEQRAELLRRPAATEAASPDGVVQWRIVAPGRLERSMNGGETWEPVTLPPSVVPTGVRALTSLSAIVSTADGREFQTDDRGKTWNPVQK